MTAFGYALSSEEHAPSDLVRNGATAEELGFDFCSVSDHFHPWVQAQGHSPFVWSILGALAASTERLEFVTGVTCPIIRTHPVIIAQAAATTSLLMDGRFTLGVGTGEALNEHIFGDRWPRPERRLSMLEEAVDVIRKMWTGETIDHLGEHYEVENARLFDPPEQHPGIVVSGYGPKAMELAGRIGDGFYSHGKDDSAVQNFLEAGGSGPRYAQINMCIGPDAEHCKQTVHEQWPNAAITGQLSQDLPTWTHFEQAATMVTPDDAVEGMPYGPDVDAVVDQVRTFIDNGFDHVFFHQIGPDQQAFFDAWRGELGDAVRSLNS